MTPSLTIPVGASIRIKAGIHRIEVTGNPLGYNVKHLGTPASRPMVELDLDIRVGESMRIYHTDVTLWLLVRINESGELVADRY